VYGLGLISREDAAGNDQTYHYDMRGSTIALTDAKGQITDTYTYDTYGEQLEHVGDSQQPFQYNGRDGVQTDPNGLYQMRARYYNPKIKRFVNRDVVTGSIGNGLTMNRYAYVNGNPVSYIDPFGLSADGADWLKQGGSFVADAIPFVGTAKGLQEVFTGVDLITGQQLSVTDRVAAGGGTLLSWLPGGKVAGKWAVKGTVEGGTWLVGKLGKMELQAVQSKYARPSELFVNDFALNGQRIAPKNLYRELRKSEIGRQTLDLIEENKIRILLDYSKKEGLYGEAFGSGKSVVYVANTQSVQKTAQIIIHEVTHNKIDSEIYTRREEVIAHMRESKHLNPNLSIGEIRNIMDQVNILYPELPYR
jgi:RHS repeat-associated protein